MPKRLPFRRGERIVWIGNNQEIVAYQGPHTEIIDLQGSFVYPGFIDTHAHVIYSGHFWRSLQLAETTSKKGLLEKLKTHLLKCQKGAMGLRCRMG